MLDLILSALQIKIEHHLIAQIIWLYTVLMLSNDAANFGRPNISWIEIPFSFWIHERIIQTRSFSEFEGILTPNRKTGMQWTQTRRLLLGFTMNQIMNSIEEWLTCSWRFSKMRSFNFIMNNQAFSMFHYSYNCQTMIFLFFFTECA